MHVDDSIPYGFCHCGCGKKTSLFPRDRPSKGQVKNTPARFLPGHNSFGRKPKPLTDNDHDVDPVTGCWVWRGRVNRDGYGLRSRKKGTRLAHRISYEQRVGVIPPGMHLHHTCRNRRCINPAHLSLVTPSENSQAPSEVRGKLTADEVRAIRALSGKLSYQEIADAFSVTYATVSSIMRRASWQHI